RSNELHVSLTVLALVRWSRQSMGPLGWNRGSPLPFRSILPAPREGNHVHPHRGPWHSHRPSSSTGVVRRKRSLRRLPNRFFLCSWPSQQVFPRVIPAHQSDRAFLLNILLLPQIFASVLAVCAIELAFRTARGPRA